MSELLERARELEPAMVDAVEALVTCESPSADTDACRNVVDEAIGAFASWVGEPARSETHDGRPVWRWGPPSPDVLLLGHLDTVWPLGSLARLPFERDDDRLRGPGVFDMKAGVVQGWAAISLLEQTSGSASIGMLLTTDEEIGSPSSRGVIAEAITHARAVLVLEPSADGALKTHRKGTSWYTVDVTGRAAHAGLDPERGINALLIAAAFALDCSQWADQAAATTVTPTILAAGTTANTVPAHAQLRIDARAWTSVEQRRIDDQFRSWRTPVDGAVVEVGGGIDRPPMEGAASAELFALAGDVARSIGLGELESRAVGGASDGNITAAAGVPTLDGLGAVGDGAHADHEWASVRGMIERSALLAGLVERLLRAQ